MLKLDDLMTKTGTSRAMIDVYVALGLLPRPVMRIEHGASIRYFPAGAAARIEAIRQLRRQGVALEEISLKLRDQPLPSAQANEPAP